MRDALLGRKIYDIDLVSDAPSNVLEQLFPQSLSVGKAFGVFVLPFAKGYSLELSSLRKEGSYTNSRHPDFVGYGTLEDDAKRRDFSINALYYDPVHAKLLDPLGGVEDLKAKLLKSVGNPQARFAEDSLRSLRAIRFLVQLDFKLDPQTEQALRAWFLNHPEPPKSLSRERVWQEFCGMLASPLPHRAFYYLEQLGGLKWCLGASYGAYKALSANKRTECKALLHCLAGGEKRKPHLAFAVLSYYLGEKFYVPFDKKGFFVQKQISRHAAKLEQLLRTTLPHQAARSWVVMDTPQGLAGWWFLWCLYRLRGDGPMLKALVQLLSEYQKRSLKKHASGGMAGRLPLAVWRGHGLQKALKLEPGPRIGELKDLAYYYQLEQSTRSKARILKHIRALLAR